MINYKLESLRMAARIYCVLLENRRTAKANTDQIIAEISYLADKLNEGLFKSDEEKREVKS